MTTPMSCSMRTTVVPNSRLISTMKRLISFFSAAFIPAHDAPSFRESWRRLEARSVEANIFYGSTFALAACRHLKRAEQPVFLFVSDTTRPAHDQLVGVLPLVAERSGGMTPAFGTWRNPYTSLGVPLIDPDSLDEVLQTMLQALANRHADDALLAFRSIDRHGMVAGALRRIARDTGQALAEANAASRALLLPTGLAPTEVTRKRRKEIARQRRRLSETGTLRFVLHRDCASVRPALERFLHLEVAGWKGARGTALVQDPGLAAFTRSALWMLAETGDARIAELFLDDRPIASAIVLVADRTAFLWKIAYDEDFAKHGPGVRLVETLSQALLADGIVAVDSCARPGHAMIESIWPGRRELADVIISVAPGPDDAVRSMIASEARRMQWRERAKGIYYSLRGWSH